MFDIEYNEGSQEVLHLIEPMWEKLLDYHKDKSKFFAEAYTNKTFQDRVKELTHSKRGMKVILVKDKETEKYIGYCVSTINEEIIGEIDSLYVEKEYRKYGIGNELMKRALDWLNKNKVKKTRIIVGNGNEEVIGFYNQYSFHTKITVLEHVSN